MTKNPTILVKSKSPDGFRRAGIAFTRAGVEIDPSTLTKAQLEAIAHEPNLIVEGAIDAEASDTGILVGSSIQPATFKFGDLDAQLGDVVAITFAKAGKTEAEWNDQADDEREALLQATVDALSADPTIFQAYLDERTKANDAAKASKPGKGKAKAAK